MDVIEWMELVRHCRKRKNLLEGTRWDPLLPLLSDRAARSPRARFSSIITPTWAMIRRSNNTL